VFLQSQNQQTVKKQTIFFPPSSLPGMVMSGVLSVTQRKLVLVAAAALLVPQSPGRMPWSAPYLGSGAVCFLPDRRQLDGVVCWIIDLLLSL